MSTATHYENANFLRELAEACRAFGPTAPRPGLSCCNGWPMKNSPRHSTANGYAPRWQRPGPTPAPR